MTSVVQTALIQPVIDLPGRGLGEINQEIRALEDQVIVLSQLNEYLVAALTPDTPIPPPAECPTETPPILMDVIAQPTVAAPPSLSFGPPSLWDVIKKPILPSDQDDTPDLVMERLQTLKEGFIYENNRLMLEVALSSKVVLDPQRIERLQACLGMFEIG